MNKSLNVNKHIIPSSISKFISIEGKVIENNSSLDPEATKYGYLAKNLFIHTLKIDNILLSLKNKILYKNQIGFIKEFIWDQQEDKLKMNLDMNGNNLIVEDMENVVNVNNLNVNIKDIHFGETLYHIIKTFGICNMPQFLVVPIKAEQIKADSVYFQNRWYPLTELYKKETVSLQLTVLLHETNI